MRSTFYTKMSENIFFRAAIDIKKFFSSWDKDNWISDVQEDHSIAYQNEDSK